MAETQPIWLVANEASGSNDRAALARVQQCCGEAGFACARVISFPQEDSPRAAELDGAGIATVAVFAGDGTVNALVTALAGWGGQVLVLPGGTMNLLSHRLHGERDFEEIVRSAAAGSARTVRPGVIACEAGTALADLLAGPGTSWYDVREAMREADVIGTAGGAARALGETLATAGIACRNPPLGAADGYPLIMLTPTDRGIRIAGYRAETPGDFFKEGWAVLSRRFREGPHDDLGLAGEVTLESTAGEPFGVLLDGERARSPPRAVFRLVPSEVDLLATRADGR